MPRVGSFGGIEIYMYFADHNPPHVHVRYGDDEALVAIADGSVIAGSVPNRQFRKAQAWIAENQEALFERWAAANP
jgi:hypothetical protein